MGIMCLGVLKCPKPAPGKPEPGSHLHLQMNI